MLEPHPWNRAFSWTPAIDPLRMLSRAQADDWNERGYFLVEDAFDAETIAGLLAEIDPLEMEVAAFLRQQPGEKLFIADANAITFSPHLVARARRLREFCSGPPFPDLAHDLIGPNVRLYWDQAVYKQRESAKSFPWHQDNGYTYVEPQQYLTCWVALTDATLENGCLWVVPGLHRLGTLRHSLTEAGWKCLEEPEAALPVPARAGSVVVLSSLTPHRTGPNRTDEVRKSYIVQFAPDGARMIQEDPHTGKRRELLQDAADRQFPVLRGGRAPG